MPREIPFSAPSRRSWSPHSCIAFLLAACGALGCGARTSLFAGSASSEDAGPPNEASAPAQQLILFGGDDDMTGETMGDTWRWDGSAWTELHIAGPSPRREAAMAAFGSKLVLFGGSDGSKELGDTWTFDGTRWTELTVTGPPPRASALMAPTATGLVLWGGEQFPRGAQTFLTDTWAWNGAAWTQIDVPGPPAREESAIASVDGTKPTIFGGLGGAQPHYAQPLSDTWQWDGTAWNQLDFITAPHWAGGMAAAGRDLVAFGGLNAESYPDGNTWVNDTTGWRQILALGPRLRTNDALATFEGTVIVFGGEGDGQDEAGTMPAGLGDTWEWDGSAWRLLAEHGPPARSRATMAGFVVD